jgi:hypothetical protein
VAKAKAASKAAAAAHAAQHGLVNPSELLGGGRHSQRKGVPSPGRRGSSTAPAGGERPRK